MATDKSLPQMAVPLVISFTLRFLFSLVDLVFAAAIAESDNSAIAAIGLYAPLQMIFIAAWAGLSGGFTASLAQAFGSRDETRVACLKRQMLKLLAVAIPLLSLTGPLLWWIAPSLGLEDDLTAAFRVYATTLLIGMPWAGFWSIYPDSLVKAHQDTRSTMIAGLLSTFTNVLLNALFALVLGWGLFGIAFATVISRFPALGYAMLRAKRLEAARRGEEWTPIPTTWQPALTTILRLAIPGSVTYLLAAAEGAVVYRVLSRLPDSTDAIATYGIYDRLLSLAMMPVMGTAVAVVPFAARLLPQRATQRIGADLRRTLLGVLGVAFGVTALTGWWLAGPITDFLLAAGNGATPDAATGAVAVGMMRWLPISALAFAPFLMLRTLFEAGNRPGAGVRLSVARYVVLSAPLVLLAGWLSSELTYVVLAQALGAGIASVLTVVAARRLLLDHGNASPTATTG